MSLSPSDERFVFLPTIPSFIIKMNILSDIPLASVIKTLAQEEAVSGHQSVEDGSNIAFVIVGLDLERLQ